MTRPKMTGALLGTAMFLCLQVAAVTYEAGVVTHLLRGVHSIIAARLALVPPGHPG